MSSTTEATWFYAQADQRKGPLTLAQMQALVDAGAVTGETRVWTQALPDWMPLRATELKALLGPEQQLPPPLPPPIAPVPASPPPFVQAPAPAYVPHAAPQVHVYRDGSALGQLLVWMSLTAAALAVIEIGVVVKGRANGSAYGRLTSFENDNTVLMVQGVVYLAYMVVYLMWFYRVTANVWATRGPQSVTPAGAVYWNFVPIAWFWRPLEAMRNAVRASGLPAEVQNGVSLWWWCFLLSGAASVGAALAEPEGKAGSAGMYVVLTLVSEAVLAVSCLMLGGLSILLGRLQVPGWVRRVCFADAVPPAA